MHWQVFDHLFPASEADKVAGLAVRASGRRFNCLNLDVVIMLILLDAENLVTREIQDVRGHSQAG